MILKKFVAVIELHSAEWVVVVSVIKLCFHECGNSVNHWNDLSSKERHLPLESVMLVLRILISTSCLCVMLVCICDFGNQSSG